MRKARDKYQNSKISITASDILKDFEIKYKDAKTKIISQKLIQHYEKLINDSKLTPEESNAIFERMMEKKRKTDKEICKKRKENYKKILEENTHVPCLNKRKLKKGKETEDFKTLTSRIDEIIEIRREKREEAKRKRFHKEKEEMRRECTFTPNINRRDGRMPRRRSVSDLYKWKMDKETKVLKSRILSQRNMLRGMTFTPKLCRGTQKLQKSQRKTELVRRLYPSKKVLKSKLANKKSEGTRFKQEKKEKKLAYKTPKKSRRRKRDLSSNVKSLSPCLKSPKLAISTVVTERSIVVLNEKGNFEEINSYIKKQRKIKKGKKIEKKIEIEAMKAIENYTTGGHTSRSLIGKRGARASNPVDHNQKILSKQFSRIKSRTPEKSPSAFYEVSRSVLGNMGLNISNQKSRRTNDSRELSQDYSDLSANLVSQLSELPLKIKPSTIKRQRHKALNKKENRKPRRGLKVNSRTPELDKSKGNYLVIKGEKIYFDKNSIKGIVDQRKKRARKSAEIVAQTFKNNFRNLR